MATCSGVIFARVSMAISIGTYESGYSSPKLLVENEPSNIAGCFSISINSPRFVITPRTLNASRAFNKASRASSLLAPWVITLAIIGSKCGVIVMPSVTPPSQRHSGTRRRVTTPVDGKLPRAGSSAYSRASKLCPRATGAHPEGSCCPSAMRNIHSTRSTPKISSVTGCSTCNRVFTSKKKNSSPCPSTMYSMVPAER